MERNIEQEIADKQTEIHKYKDRLNTIALEKYELEKKLIEVKEGLRKGRHIISQKNLELDMLKNEFWRQRNG